MGLLAQRRARGRPRGRRPQIAAVVVQVPWFGDARSASQTLRQLLQPSTLRLVAAGIRDAIRGARGRPPYLVPIVGEPGQTALFTGPRSRPPWRPRGWRARCGATSSLLGSCSRCPRYQPGKLLERLGMPLLVCVADRDRETPASHFEMYYGETFKQVLTDQVDFLRSHLLSAAASRA